MPENATIDSYLQLICDVREWIAPFRQCFYFFAIPLIATCGVMGNALTLSVLTLQRVRPSFGCRVCGTSFGIAALATSDVLVCLTILPTSILSAKTIFLHREHSQVVARTYSAYFINVFILTSTWMIIVVAVERYIAICHPLQSYRILSIRKTRIAVCVIGLVSMVFNMPFAFKFRPVAVSITSLCGGGRVNITAVHVTEVTFVNWSFEYAYRITWALMGNFVPLVSLAYFNVCLVVKIGESQSRQWRMRTGQFSLHSTATPPRRKNAAFANRRGTHVHRQDGLTLENIRLTKSLIFVVFIFLACVAPSELIKVVILFTGSKHMDHNKAYKLSEAVTNFMQTVSFASNFVFYCFHIKSFRRSAIKLVLAPLRSLLACRGSRTKGLGFARYRNESARNKQATEVVSISVGADFREVAAMYHVDSNSRTLLVLPHRQ